MTLRDRVSRVADALALGLSTVAVPFTLNLATVPAALLLVAAGVVRAAAGGASADRAPVEA